MIHSASPQIRRTICMKIVITTYRHCGRPRGSKKLEHKHVRAYFSWPVQAYIHKTGVVNDPLGQSHNPAIAENILKVWKDK